MLFRLDIRRKLNTVLTLCGLLVIGIFAPIISYYSFDQYEQQAREQQARLVGAVRASAAIASFVANEEIASEVISGLLQDDEILAVELTGTNGFTQLDQSQTESPRVLAENSATDYPLFSPVDKVNPVGLLRVWSNDALIAERVRTLVYKDIGLLVLMTLILALVSMIASNYLVGRPLRRLSRQVSKTKPGANTSITVGRQHQNDEIGLVAKSFNEFLSVTHNAIENERELRAQIEKMNRHFSNIFDTSLVGIMVVDEQGHLLHHNPVIFERIIQLDEQQQKKLGKQEVFSQMFSDPSLVWQAIEAAKRDATTVELDLELKSQWQRQAWVHCVLSVNQDAAEHREVIEMVIYDVTSRVMETLAAKKMAEQDPLTGLLNRRGCEVHIKRRLARPDTKRKLVAMLLDLDGFKPVNDTFGHNAGDEVLQEIAQRIKSVVRSDTDEVSRIGGDEFVVLIDMESHKEEYVESIARKIIESVSAPIRLNDGQTVYLGVSIGIAFARNFETLESLVQAADDAMYKVKMAGKNDFAFAS